MQRGDDRHSQLTQQRQHMAARRSAKNAELVFHAHHVHVRDVQEIRRAEVGRQFLLGNFETDLRRVIIALRAIINRHDKALHLRELLCHRAAQIRGKRGDTALFREISAEKSDLANGR